MTTLMAPLQSMHRRLARRRQMRTALHMLSASGVIRPSHVEFRYASSVQSHRPSRRHREAAAELLTEVPTRSPQWQSPLHMAIGQIGQWLMTLSPRTPQPGQ